MATDAYHEYVTFLIRMHRYAEEKGQLPNKSRKQISDEIENCLYEKLTSLIGCADVKKKLDIKKYICNKLKEFGGSHEELTWDINHQHRKTAEANTRFGETRDGRCMCLVCCILHANHGFFSDDCDSENMDEISSIERFDSFGSCGSACSDCGGHKCSMTEQERDKWDKLSGGNFFKCPANWKEVLLCV